MRILKTALGLLAVLAREASSYSLPGLRLVRMRAAASTNASVNPMKE